MILCILYVVDDNQWLRWIGKNRKLDEEGIASHVMQADENREISLRLFNEPSMWCWNDHSESCNDYIDGVLIVCTIISVLTTVSKRYDSFFLRML